MLASLLLRAVALSRDVPSFLSFGYFRLERHRMEEKLNGGSLVGEVSARAEVRPPFPSPFHREKKRKDGAKANGKSTCASPAPPFLRFLTELTRSGWGLVSCLGNPSTMLSRALETQRVSSLGRKRAPTRPTTRCGPKHLLRIPTLFVCHTPESEQDQNHVERDHKPKQEK